MTEADAFVQSITTYWRRVQLASALEGLKDERDRGTIRSPFDHSQFVAGIAPQPFVMDAFKKADETQKSALEKRRRSNPNARPDPPPEFVDVLISPFGIRLPGEKDPIYVVSAHAKMNRRGELATGDPASDIPPIWIGRPFLGPAPELHNDQFPLADAEEYFDAIETALNEIEEWPDDWQEALGCHERIWELTGADSADLYYYLGEHYQLDGGWIRYDERDPKLLTIARTYDKISGVLKSKPSALPLYRQICLGKEDHVYRREATYRHLGQMGGDHPLKPSQRDALLSFLSTPKEHIAAINGPPGTGKTTLLQSVVASEMVRTAAEDAAQPPLFLASAATNQAVSNIIEAFRKATKDLDHPLAGRWIIGIERRYGIYFRGSRGTAEELAKGSLVCMPRNLDSLSKAQNVESQVEGFIDDVERKNRIGEEVGIEYILTIGESARARREFLRSCSAEFGNVVDVQDARRLLLDRVRQKVAITEEYAKAGDSFRDVVSGLGFPSTASFRDVENDVVARIGDAESDRAETIARNRQWLLQQEDTEREKRLEEDRDIETFDSGLREVDRRLDRLASERLSWHEASLRQLESLDSDFESLRQPTTFLGTLLEMLPWVKAGKRLRLQRLARSLPARNLGVCTKNELGDIRLWIENMLSGIQVLQAQRKDVQEEVEERRRVAEARRHEKQEAVFTARRKRKEERERIEAANARVEQAKEAQVLHLEVRFQDFRAAMSFWKRAAAKAGILEIPSRLDEIDGLIDTTLRLDAFLLATHYWEARFLLAVGETGWRVQKNRYEAYRLMAMLAPCFVSTFDKVGMVFNIMQTPGVVDPLWNFADVLIIDEAGQASPDKGAFAFAFAKKALVVGDTLQLPPVESTDSATVGTMIARSCRLDKDMWAVQRGMLTGKTGTQETKGSIMWMATQAAHHHLATDTKGMWLRDHFRCDPRIVEYCNEIWYPGETSLIPWTKKVDGFAPPFGFVDVSGEASHRKNIKEAQAIIAWIARHGSNLQELHDGKSINEIVAVLTPFKNQAKELRELRKKQLEPHSDLRNVEKMVIGTVHALQGAERPIILFSTVYHEWKPSYFFDREWTMLNVAVSRAQESFIVFGSRTVFGGDGIDKGKPSTLLRRHLFQRDFKAVPQSA